LEVELALLKYVLLALFVLSIPVAVATPAPDAPLPRERVTFDYLMEACSDIGDSALGRGKIPFFDCHSYIYGVLDGYLLARALLPNNKRACFPSDLTPWQVMQALLPLLRSRNYGPQPASLVVIDTLRAKYPCR
jgi:hypothetical protein